MAQLPTTSTTFSDMIYTLTDILEGKAMKARAFLISLIIMALLMSTACSSIEKLLGLSEFLTPKDERQFYTAAELEELYDANKESCTNVADLILASDELLECMKERSIYDYQIFSMDDKQFFSDSEWEDIVDFFKMSRVLFIQRNRASGDCILFYFTKQTVDGTDTAVSLYYFPQPTEELLEHHSRPWNLTEFYPIDTNWWIRVCETPRSSLHETKFVWFSSGR